MEENTQVSTPPQKTSRSKQVITTVVIAMIAAIFSSAVTYLIMSSQRSGQSSAPNQRITPTTQASPTQQASESIISVPEATADWKTYTAKDGTFSFKYPASWIYETKTITREFRRRTYDAIYIEAGEPLTEERRKMQGFIDINDAPKTMSTFSLEYTTHADFKNVNANDLVEEMIRKHAADVDEPKTLLLPGNVEAKEVGYGCQAYCIDTLFRNGSTIFDASTGPNADSNIAIMHKILSTLKFFDK